MERCAVSSSYRCFGQSYLALSVRGQPCQLPQRRPSAAGLAKQPNNCGLELFKRSPHRRSESCHRHAIRSIESEDSASISDLQAQLDAAIANEDYETAATLRDQLMEKRLDNVAAVEAANKAFYDAFQNGDIAAMEAIWGEGEHVQCIHPAAGCIAGRETVLASWRMVLGAAKFIITLEDVRIFTNESMGYVTCMEVVDSGDSRGRIVATNVFEKQNGGWKIVHHQGGPKAAI